MRGMIAVAAVIAVSALVGCQSAQGLCRDEVDQLCDREFECRSAAERGSSPFQQQFGTTLEECKTKLYADPILAADQIGVACDDADTDQEVCSNWGRPTATVLDFGKANECRDAREALTCTDFLTQVSTSSAAPAACGQRCR